MFGTSGIRGVYGRDITPALAAEVASLFASGRLAVGRDIRESGPALFDAVVRGASAAGVEVLDLGIVPTPTVALATRAHGCRGIMLTASHNPPEYNGLKLIENAKEIGKALEADITARFGGRMRIPAEKARVIHDPGIVPAHIALAKSMVDSTAISRKAPKVVVDCNGAASALTPYLLSDLGCRVVSVNSSPHCFNRPSEPSPKNLAYLGGFVREAGADFAIAHDGDGDRCALMDERGEMLPLDAQLSIMMEHELEIAGGGRVVTTVESSLAVREAAARAGGEAIITPVGSTFVGDALEESGALFGGEPCGEYIYSNGVHVPDAVLAAAKFAEIFCTKGPFSKLKTRYPQNPMARERFPAKDRKESMERILEKVRGLGIGGAIRDDDGIRLDEEGGWFLIRASGTEPIIRLTMEYRDEKALEKRKALLAGIIRECL